MSDVCRKWLVIDMFAIVDAHNELSAKSS